MEITGEHAIILSVIIVHIILLVFRKRILKSANGKRNYFIVFALFTSPFFLYPAYLVYNELNLKRNMVGEYYLNDSTQQVILTIMDNDSFILKPNKYLSNHGTGIWRLVNEPDAKKVELNVTPGVLFYIFCIDDDGKSIYLHDFSEHHDDNYGLVKKK